MINLKSLSKKKITVRTGINSKSVLATMTNAFSSTDSSEALVDIVALYDLFDAKNYEIWVVHPYDPKSDYKIDIHEPIVYSKKQEDVIDTTVHVKKEDYEIIKYLAKQSRNFKTPSLFVSQSVLFLYKLIALYDQGSHIKIINGDVANDFSGHFDLFLA